MADSKRTGGILMPVFSLPSRYGIGTFGRSARDFIDFLEKAGQTSWQILPLGPTSYGDSPYQSFSTYAGNPYFIDLELLCADGLLDKKELDALNWGTEPHYVDYGKIYESRYKVLRKAFAAGRTRYAAEIEAFRAANAEWLPGYALFMALKKYFNNKAWTEWPDRSIRMHEPEACRYYASILSEDVAFYEFIQFLFFRQWEDLRAYAHAKNISIIGDIPIYVAMDSADVWSEPQFFQLDSDNRPIEIAGVPPDYFSEDGQLWGNPLYDWKRMEADGFGWWIRRIGGASRLYDVIRIDHFRGFESYWAIPYGEKTAKKGRWVKGPGMKVISVISGWFADLSFIAEDLGILTDAVRQCLKDSGFPGMKVLEFAFAGEDSDYLPHNHIQNCVCYTGTHDNAPLGLWYKEGTKEEIAHAKEYLGIGEEEGFVAGLLRAGLSSTADLFVAQMQDYLCLTEGSRVNIPGTLGGNWEWRIDKDALTDELAAHIYKLTKRYGRLNPAIVKKLAEEKKKAEEAARKAEEANKAADAKAAAAGKSMTKDSAAESSMKEKAE